MFKKCTKSVQKAPNSVLKTNCLKVKNCAKVFKKCTKIVLEVSKKCTRTVDEEYNECTLEPLELFSFFKKVSQKKTDRPIIILLELLRAAIYYIK